MDFLEKPINAVELVESVEKAMKLDLQYRYARSHTELKVNLLTSRERDVMEWMLEGKSNEMISRILDINSRTVGVLRGNITRKMEANSLVDLANMISKLQK